MRRFQAAGLVLGTRLAMGFLQARMLHPLARPCDHTTAHLLVQVTADVLGIHHGHDAALPRRPLGLEWAKIC